MQIKEKVGTDTRSLSEIWAELDDYTRGELRSELSSKLGKTTATIWNWVNGKTRPNDVLVMKEVCKIIRNKVGIDVGYATLFPCK